MRLIAVVQFEAGSHGGWWYAQRKRNHSCRCRNGPASLESIRCIVAAMKTSPSSFQFGSGRDRSVIEEFGLNFSFSFQEYERSP
jgi:hypothetical protein